MKDGHREGGLLFERLVFFSDAVFAIAITLLVLDLRLPPPVHGAVDVSGIGPKLFGFALSFAVIGIYWLSHHRLFGGLQADDGALRVVNLAFLASVVFLPFPTSVIAEYPAASFSVRFYACSVGAVGVLLILLTLVARRRGLLAPGQRAGETARLVIYAVSAPTIFFISTAWAGKAPFMAMQLWWLIIPAQIGAGLAGPRVKAWIDRPRG
jgi:uncharacterized membrane protein